MADEELLLLLLFPAAEDLGEDAAGRRKRDLNGVDDDVGTVVLGLFGHRDENASAADPDGPAVELELPPDEEPEQAHHRVGLAGLGLQPLPLLVGWILAGLDALGHRTHHLRANGLLTVPGERPELPEEALDLGDLGFPVLLLRHLGDGGAELFARDPVNGVDERDEPSACFAHKPSFSEEKTAPCRISDENYNLKKVTVKLYPFSPIYECPVAVSKNETATGREC